MPEEYGDHDLISLFTFTMTRAVQRLTLSLGSAEISHFRDINVQYLPSSLVYRDLLEAARRRAGRYRPFSNGPVSH
jgi:hypothetical protein